MNFAVVEVGLRVLERWDSRDKEVQFVRSQYRSLVAVLDPFEEHMVKGCALEAWQVGHRNGQRTEELTCLLL
jgi:hypothetical protein